MGADGYREGERLTREGLFQLVAEAAWRDHVLDEREVDLLRRVARFLKLGPEGAREVLHRARERVREGGAPGAGPLSAPELYERAEAMARSDGAVDQLEEGMLRGLRALLKLPERQAAPKEWLAAAVEAWVGEGLIEAPQARRILAREGLAPAAKEAPVVPLAPPPAAEAPFIYIDEHTAPASPPRPAPPPPPPPVADAQSVGASLGGILIFVAAVLLGVGILLFYAANWRYMSPALKLFQVLLVITGFYAAAWHNLARRDDRETLGRALLNLGLISFGAGLALVAQIFHISAHPSNGVLAWCLAAVATSWVTRDRAAAVLAATLSMVWLAWEASVYGSPAAPYPFILAALAALWLRLESSAGLGAVALQAILWFYVANGAMLADAPTSGQSAMAFCLLHVAWGAFLVAAGRLCTGHPLGGAAGGACAFFGWWSLLVPLLVLALNLGVEPRHPMLDGSLFLGVEHLGLLALAAAGHWLLTPRERRVTVLPGCLGLGLVVLAVPMVPEVLRPTVTQFLLLGFTLGVLGSPDARKAPVEGWLGPVFAVVAVLTVQAVDVAGAAGDSALLVPRLLASVTFLAVAALGERTASLLAERAGAPAQTHFVGGLAAVLPYLHALAVAAAPAAAATLAAAEPALLVRTGANVAVAVALALGLRAEAPGRGGARRFALLAVGAVLLAMVPRPFVLNLAFLALGVGMLYAGRVAPDAEGVHAGGAGAFLVILLAIRHGVAAGDAFSRDSLYAAHLLHGILFALVILLGARAAAAWAARSPRYEPIALLEGLCALVVYLDLFALSSKLPSQSSVSLLEPAQFELLALHGVAATLLALAVWPVRGDVPGVGAALLTLAGTGALMATLPGLGSGPACVLVNLALLVYLGLVLSVAVRLDSRGLANLAIAGFLLQMVVRYFDVLWDMLSGSALFIVTGLLVLLGGHLVDKHRRQLLDGMAPPTGTRGGDR